MARNRSARVAVLGAGVQRSPSRDTPRPGRHVRRRLVVLTLVVAALALVTLSFRESQHGTIHRLQDYGSSALRPFQVAANEVAQPFRDASHWLSGLSTTRDENRKLRAEVDRLRTQAIAGLSAQQENAQLRALLQYQDGPTYPGDFRPVAARVISRAPNEFDQRLILSVGLKDGVRRDDPVVTADGLVGIVTQVSNHVAQVTQITDGSSSVSAVDLQTGAAGLAHASSGGSPVLTLDRVTKDKIVDVGDQVVTSGWRYGKLASLYPKGIPVGRVSNVGQTDTDLYKQVQVTPFVDGSSLEAVLVLVPKPGVAQQ